MSQNIDFDIIMRDRGATATGNKFDKTLSGIDKNQKNVSKSAGSLWKQFAVGLGVTTAITAVARKLINTFTDGIKAAADFEKEMANVSTLVDTSAVSMGAFEQGILDMAGELGSATDLTQGLYQALSAGVEPAKALDFVAGSAKFAKAALTDTLGAVDLLSTVINAYGMEASEAAHVSDVLFQTIKDGKTTGELLAGAMGRIIPTAATMGINLETVSAALATMTKGGISTDEAVTALNQTLMAVLKPGAEAAKTANQLGLDFSKAGIEGAGGFEKWLIKLKAAVGDNETIMAKLFPNVRGLKAVFALTGAQAGEFSKIMGNMADVSDNVNEAFKKQQETAAATMDAIKNQMSAAFTEALLPALRDFAAWVRENKEGIISTFKAIVEVFKGIVQVAGLVVGAVGKVISELMKYKEVQMIVEGWGKILKIPESIEAVGELERENEKLIKSFYTLGDQANAAQNKFSDFFKTLDTDSFISLREAIGPIPEDFKDGGEQAHYFNKIMLDIARGKYGEKLAVDFKKFNDELKTLRDRDYLEKTLGSFESLGIISGDTSKSIVNFKDKLIETFTPMETIVIKLDPIKEKTKLTKEELEKLKAATEELAKSMDILTKQGYNEQSKEIDILLSLYKDYQHQILGNEETTRKWIDKINELTLTALPEEKELLNDIRISLSDYGKNIPYATDATKKFTGELLTYNLVIGDFIESNAGSIEIIEKLLEKEEEQKKKEEELIKKKEELIKKSEELSDAYNSLSGGISNQLMAQFDSLRLGIEGMSSAISGKGSLIDGIQGFAIAGNSAANILGTLGIASDKTVKHIGDLTKGVSDLALGITSGDPFQIIAGGIQTITTLFDIFKGKSGELEAAERRLSGLSGATEDWAARIEELAKQMGGADSAGRAFNALLADIIRDSDITVGNFDNYITKVREIVSTYEQGNATIEETQRNFGAAFDAIIQSAQTLGIEGAQSLRGLIELADEFGLSVQEINDYISANMKTALGGWQEAVKTFGDYSIPIFDDMLALQGKIADNQQLIDSIKGANQAMMDLAKTPNFNIDQFKVFEQIAVDAMQRLEDSGFSAAQAMESDAGLRGMLQNIIFLSEQYGFKIDDATQALIDQGVASGALTQQQKSESDIMVDGFDRMIGRMDKLIMLMGGEMPDAVDYMASRAIGAIRGIETQTDRWGNSVRNVSGEIGDIISNVSRLGDTHDDIMWGHSIIPDMIRWALENENITQQIKNDLVSAVRGLGGEYDDIIDNIEGNPLFEKKLFDEYKSNFSSLFKTVLTDSKIGTRSFFDIIDKATSLGLGDSVEKFRKETMEAAYTSYSKIKDIQALDTTKLLEDIKKKEEEINKADTVQGKSSLTGELNELQLKLADITSAQKVFGSTSIGVFEEMHAWQQKLSENKELIQGIDSATSLLTDFSKAQQLTEDQYQEFEDIVASAWTELENKGFKTNDIYKQLGPILERLNALNNEFGYDVDENTKKLIAEGLKKGKISEDMKTDAEKQIELAEKQYELWLQIAKLLAGDVTDNLGGINDAIKEIDMGDGYSGYAELNALEQEWKDKWQEIAASEEMTGKYIEELSQLDVGENLKVKLKSLIEWATLTGGKIQEGFVWDPETKSFIQPAGFQFGTGPQGFKIPEGYPNDSFKAGFSSGEKIYVEPKGGFHGVQNVSNGGDTWNLYVTINAAPGGETPRSLMDKLYYGIKNNSGGGRAKLKRIGVQING